jgi:UDP-N-acetylmuramoylalanine--D-glutamate ligase
MQPYARALVCGLGESGEAAALLLRTEGSTVTVVDRGDTPALRARGGTLERQGVHVLLAASSDLPTDPFDVCIVSPGIAESSSWVAGARSRCIPVLSELELGWSRARSRMVAVTGSNGKSSAVKWLAESLQAAGLTAAPAGNYGPAMCRMVREQPNLNWLVLEVSSFQLETVDQFRPDVGILLNIHPNHFDRHKDLRTYTATKARLFAKMRPADTCIVHQPVMAEVRALAGGDGRWLSFGNGPAADYRYEEGRVLHKGSIRADLSGTYFGNPVLGLAAAAVIAGIEACGLDAGCAVRAARAFEPLPHRMEVVGEVGGVKYINDSKATNLSAMAAALRMLPGKTRLIAGGLVKENDFSFVKEVLAQKVVGVYLIGQASEVMASAWSDVVPCLRCGTLSAAVARAGRDASLGETVLLSPACASFDQFRNFEERGDCFTELVRNLAEEETR